MDFKALPAASFDDSEPQEPVAKYRQMLVSALGAALPPPQLPCGRWPHDRAGWQLLGISRVSQPRFATRTRVPQEEIRKRDRTGLPVELGDMLTVRRTLRFGVALPAVRCTRSGARGRTLPRLASGSPLPVL